MNDALFVDVSNLNVLFKTNGKFVLAANYNACPERLTIDAQALGNSFDVYLSMWPRAVGEGDIEVGALSLGSVPFIALRKELEVVFELVRDIPGVNNVYLCNALANSVVPARVPTFTAVMCAGNRYACVEVQDKHISKCQYFATQKDFYEAMGDDYSCYGDVDLIDANSIKAQYPELDKLKKVDLVPLVALIISYKSAYKVEMEAVDALLSSVSGSVVVPSAEVELQSDADTEGASEQPAMMDVPEGIEPTSTVKGRGGLKGHTNVSRKKVRFDVVAALLILMFCVGMGLNGFFYKMQGVGTQALRYDTERTILEERLTQYDDVISVYQYGVEMAGQSASVLEFASATELPVSVSVLRQTPGDAVLTFVCADTQTRDQFIGYLSQKYLVLEVYEYEVLKNTDGTESHRYGVSLDVAGVIPQG